MPRGGGVGALDSGQQESGSRTIGMEKCRKDNINYLRLLEWEFVRNQRSSLDCVPLRQTDIQFKISATVLFQFRFRIRLLYLLVALWSGTVTDQILGLNNYLCVGSSLVPKKVKNT